MKKCLFGLLVIISLIIPISNVKADVIYGGETFPDIVNDENDSFILFSNSAGGTHFGFGTYLLTYNKTDLSYITIRRDNQSSYPYKLRLYKNTEMNEYASISYKAYKLTDGEWVLENDRINFSHSGGKSVSGLKNIYYSNDTIYMDKNSYKDISMYYDKNGLATMFESNITELNYSQTFSKSIISTGYENVLYSPPQKVYLNTTLTFANDLDNNEIYIAKFNAINYNPDYQYLIRTSQEIEWTDITDLLNNEAYQYSYSLYYNTTLYIQVLNSEGDVLETKTHTISDLKDFQFNISHNEANDLNNRLINVVIVDVRNIYFSDYKYQYSFDNQIFYDMEITEDNKIYNLPHALNIPIHFRILNAGDIVIHQQIYNGNFENVKKEINFFEKTNINDNKKEVIVQVDFTEYLKFYDMYNFKIWIDDIEYDEQTFIKEFILTEENYVKAIRVKMSVDNLILENFTYRIGTITGTGGGSDNDFNGIYDNVLENELNNELKEQDYSTIPGMVDAVKNFIKATGEYITTFFELIMYFFNKLNVWIKTCIIALFIELIIFKTIKAVRR